MLGTANNDDALVFQHKYRNVLKSRFIYWRRSKMTEDIKGILHFFMEIGSFYNSHRVKQLSFTIFKCIQPIF